MILLMRNHVDEFVPGCDYTAVNMDSALVETITQRAASCRLMRVRDSSLAELRYWDASPRCIGSLVPAMEATIEEALERGGGWAVMGDGAISSFSEARADCTHMVIVACDSPILAWSYRIGSEPIRTVDVPLADLVARLGSPLGDPLRELP